MARRSRALGAYVGCLALALALALAHLTPGMGAPAHIGAAVVLTVLFALTELTDLTFHGKSGDWGLSASEALLLPMIVVLTPGEVVWGVTLAIAGVGLYRLRAGMVKSIFNVAQYGCGAAAAVAVWEWLSEPASTLSARNAAAAVAAVLSFTFLTHVFVAGAIAIAEGGRFTKILRGVGPAALINVAGGIVLGLLFGASTAASPWTIGIFPLPLLGLYLGYRAVLRQRDETERLRHLHAASRALASGADLDAAILGFLRAVREIVSAREVRVVLKMGRNTVWSGVDGERVLADMERLELDGLAGVLMEVETTEAPVLLLATEPAADAAHLMELGARNLVAVPLLDDEGVLGCLVAVDRLGPGDFGEAESLLLEAVAGELMTTLDAHRLFAEVTEERQRFSRIFHGSREGIALVDDEGVVRAWNPALERITGYEAAEVMGRTWSERVLIRRADQLRVATPDLLTLDGGEVEVVTKEGPGRWVSVAAGAVGSGDDRAWVLLVRDVTADHEAEEAKSDFLSTISHELRTPLTSIKGALQVLERGSNNISADLSDQMVTVMQRGSDRLERLVMNLLLVSQIETDGLPPSESDDVALDDLVTSSVARVLSGHRARVADTLGGAFVRADRDRLEQVLEHVLDNAAKFGGRDGVVTVAVTRDHDCARVSITDEGPGIPSSDHERIFDRFVRLGNVLTRSTQGAGVGLFIARRAMAVMGGEIWVESEPGRGATFHLRIPLARPLAVAESA
ncbi:MAG: ATP-binding protein [Actinomycetota bacterium]|nr:ATP-binding protein [Actinomycetota bacterium]